MKLQMLCMIFFWTLTLLTLPLLCHIEGGFVEIPLLSEVPMTLPLQAITNQDSRPIKLPISPPCYVLFPTPTNFVSILPLMNCFPPLMKGPPLYLIPIPLMSCLVSLPSYDMPELPLPPMTQLSQTPFPIGTSY